MAGKPGFFDFVKRAFNARPFGMVVPPNWVGLTAMGLLGLVNPGFWVLGRASRSGICWPSRPTTDSAAGRAQATIGVAR